MTERNRCLPVFAGVLATLVAVLAGGCVSADPAKPWSTRDQSKTNTAAEPGYQIVRPIVIETAEVAIPGEVPPDAPENDATVLVERPRSPSHSLRHGATISDAFARGRRLGR